MQRFVSVVCVATFSALVLAAAVPASAEPTLAPSTVPAAPAVPDELLVGYVVGASATDRARGRGRASAQLKEHVVEARADRKAVELVRLPQGSNRNRAIAELESDPAVAYAEPNWVYTHEAKPGGGGGTAPDYYGDGSLWGMYGDASSPANQYGSQAAEAWAAGNVGAKSVYVGVIDTGIQHTHPDLVGQIGSNPGEVAANGVDDDGNGYVDDVHGWDFANGDNSIYDGGTRGSLDDHGTHVAGTIGAVNEDGTAVPSGGQKGVVGVSQKVTLLNAKFLGRYGGSTANAVKAVDYFTDLKVRHGLNIVATNNSWGGGGFAQSLLDAIVRGAKQDILFVAAAGNDGANNDTTQSYPANYDTTAAGAGYDAVISVAAIDKTGGLATFSNYGARTVDLGAPGVGVWSTTAYNTYSSYNGTSMATPHVSGGVALYAASHPGSGGAEIRQALLTAIALTESLAGKTSTGGRLNVSGF